MTTTNTHKDLNQISEEDFELYKDEAENVDLDLDETPIEDEESLEVYEGFAALAALRQAVKDLSVQTADACNTEAAIVSYVPNISDFDHQCNYALRWGYYDYFAEINGMAIQSVRLGPQLLVRAAPQSIKTLPVNEERFTEFWLDAFDDADFYFEDADEFDDADADDANVHYRPSPALKLIKSFLDAHEDDYDPIPEELVLQAHAENPDAVTKPFEEFAPYGGYANSKTPKALRLNLKIVASLPETINTLGKVLEQAVSQVENSFARMNPSMSSSSHLGEPTLASSKAFGRETSRISGISSPQITSATRPNPTAG